MTNMKDILKENYTDIAEWQKKQSPALLKKITNNYEKLIHSIAQKYYYTNLDYDDLYIEGLTGLLLALEKFDVSRNTKFSTYAYFWILSQISRFVKKQEKIFSEEVNNYENIQDLLTNSSNEYENEELKEIREQVKLSIYELSIKEKKILNNRLLSLNPMTFKELGILLNMSPEGIRQIEQKILFKIKNKISYFFKLKK